MKTVSKIPDSAVSRFFAKLASLGRGGFLAVILLIFGLASMALAQTSTQIADVRVRGDIRSICVPCHNPHHHVVLFRDKETDQPVLDARGIVCGA